MGWSQDLKYLCTEGDATNLSLPPVSGLRGPTARPELQHGERIPYLMPPQKGAQRTQQCESVPVSCPC